MDCLLIADAEKYVKKVLGNDSSGHDYWHCIRVKRLANSISSLYDCNKDLVELASILHDVDDYKIFGNNSHQHLIEFCRLNGVSDMLLDDLIQIIEFLSLDKIDATVSIESKIVQDADNLDGLGAIGIARMFAFGGANKKNVYNGTEDDSFSHYYLRLINLPKMMNTDFARKEAEKRMEVMNYYFERFKMEINQGGKNE